MARGFLEVAAPAAVVVVKVAAEAAAGVAGEDEVPEIYNGDADGHGSDSLQQRLPPREETAVVSMDKEEKEEEVRALVRSVCWCAWSVGENRFEMSLWALLSCLRSSSRAFLLCLL